MKTIEADRESRPALGSQCFCSPTQQGDADSFQDAEGRRAGLGSNNRRQIVGDDAKGSHDRIRPAAGGNTGGIEPAGKKGDRTAFKDGPVESQVG